MKVSYDIGAYEVSRAHKTDAGIDLKAAKGGMIPPKGSAVFDTGVHVELPKGTCGVLMSKSGLNVNYSITSTGLIDEGYTGSIKVKLYNHSSDEYWINAGDKITQLVVMPVLYEMVEVVDKIDNNTERGDKGFGSSGK